MLNSGSCFSGTDDSLGICISSGLLSGSAEAGGFSPSVLRISGSVGVFGFSVFLGSPLFCIVLSVSLFSFLLSAGALLSGFSVISAVLLLDASAGVSDISDTVSVMLLSAFTATLLTLSFSALHPARLNTIIAAISISRFFIHITSTYTIQIFHGKSREIFISPEKATYFALDFRPRIPPTPHGKRL